MKADPVLAHLLHASFRLTCGLGFSYHQYLQQETEAVRWQLLWQHPLLFFLAVPRGTRGLAWTAHPYSFSLGLFQHHPARAACRSQFKWPKHSSWPVGPSPLGVFRAQIQMGEADDWDSPKGHPTTGACWDHLTANVWRRKIFLFSAGPTWGNNSQLLCLDNFGAITWVCSSDWLQTPGPCCQDSHSSAHFTPALCQEPLQLLLPCLMRVDMKDSCDHPYRWGRTCTGHQHECTRRKRWEFKRA